MPLLLLVIDQGSPYVEKLLSGITPDSDIELLGRAADVAGLSRLVTDTPPDVVFVDGEVVAGTEDESFARLTELFPDANIFVLTERDPIEALRRTIGSPATAMVSRDAAPMDVLAEMRNAAAGTLVVHREFVPSLVRQLRYFPRRVATQAPDSSPLTPRETEVLSMLSRGTHVDAIARTLELSVHTVRGHVKNILAKLESHSQLEAVAKAKDLGWVLEAE